MHLARILVHLHIVLHHKDLPDLLWVGSLLVHLAPAYTPALPLLKGSYHAKRRLGEDKVDMAESYRYSKSSSENRRHLGIHVVGIVSFPSPTAHAQTTPPQTPPLSITAEIIFSAFMKKLEVGRED